MDNTVCIAREQRIFIGLPNGHFIMVDTRSTDGYIVEHLDKGGDYVDGWEIPVDDDDPEDDHPSLSAAERNPNLR